MKSRKDLQMGKVINFHKVTDSQWFETVVCFLKSHYTMIGAEQLIKYYYNRSELPPKSCLITVDDGEMTSYSVIYPILKKYQVPAIFFVSPQKTVRSGENSNFWFQEVESYENSEELMSQIHNGPYTVDEIWELIIEYRREHHTEELEDQNMTLEQVLEIDREGLVTIGAHTLEHPFLARESEERSAYEINASMELLSSLLGHPIRTFAYPNGQPGLDFGQREIDVLAKTSCQIAFSTEPKDFSNQDSPFAIPRFGLSCGSLLFIWIKLMLGSHYLTIKNIILRMGRIVNIENR